jgi:uncharacterized heparinase superfamily protein
MPATLPVFADEPRPEGEVLPLKVARLRRPAPHAMWPEAAGRLAWRGFVPLLHNLRRGWLYHQTLRGILADRFILHPRDPRPRRLEDADAIMRGRFKLAGQTVESSEGSIFDQPPPSPEFAAALHGFEWLRHLEAAGGELSREVALGLMQNWLKRNAYYTLPAWEPSITAERLFNLFAHGRFFLTNSNLVWRSRLFVSLRDQMVVLSRSLDEAQGALPRLKAAAVLVVAGICLGDAVSAGRGLKRLAYEIESQILPDGGHIGRSPEALLEAFRALAMAQDALDGAEWRTNVTLRTALERMADMLAFFRMGDGRFPNFNGGNEGELAMLEALGIPDGEDIAPFAHAAHSGFQRLAQGRTQVLMDAGCAPAAAFSSAAHAGCLAFEMSSGEDRIIVNCGSVIGRARDWNTALRATAAHSTLTLDDTSQSNFLQEGWVAKLLGARMLDGPATVETRRSHGTHGLSVESTHDGYASRFGLLHQRRMTLGPKGAMLSGSDRLIPVDSKTWTRTLSARARRDGLPFAVRFHVHPDIRVSLAQARGSVILKLPGGEGWRFRCAGGTLSVEESIYFGNGNPRRAEQLVINGLVRDAPAETAWVFEQVGTS